MTPTELATELLRLANLREAEAAADLFVPGAEICFPRFAPRRVFRGGPEIQELFAWLVETLPVSTFAADRITAAGGSATVEFETAGRSLAGHEFDSSGALVIDTEGGLISAVRVYLDTADLGRILGGELAQPRAAGRG